MPEAVDTLPPLPIGAAGRNSVGWAGMLCLIATESSLFAYLLFSYYFMALQRGPAWLPEAHPSMALAGPDTVVLLASSAAVWWGEEGVKRGRRGLAIALGVVFLVVQALEWKAKSYGLDTSAYGSLYFTITGFHMAHVVVGLGVLATVFAWSLLGYFSPRHHARMTIASVYWHFVDVVWLFVFTTFYLSPYVLT